MANIVELECPIDGLTVDVAVLQKYADDMAVAPVGTSLKYETDETVVCANGHHWAINFQVTVDRAL